MAGTKVKVVDEQGEELTSGTGHIWIGISHSFILVMCSVVCTAAN